jgi:two-component system response regulator AtoC
MTARLAVVDDDPAFTEFLRMFLQARDYSVQSFNSGVTLLKALHGDAPPNAILLDVAMPDPDGLETLRMVRGAHPGVPVIMLSGNQSPSTIVEAIRLGAADYLLKPGDSAGQREAALEAAIRSVLERQSILFEAARAGLSDDELDEPERFWGLSSSAMAPILSMLPRVADSDLAVLLLGESGVGKEVIGRELHRRSSRRTKPFIKVNCAALPAELLESELFGHERGAFTGAGGMRIGKFEFAHQGTLMLDEIGEMSAGLQAKLLHVLQDGSFTRLGSNRPVEVDVRIVAATNRNIDDMLRAGTFREDLYYRLQGIELFVPPLRDRRDEIGPLADFFLAKYARAYRRPPIRISDTLEAALLRHGWPGNIRELENMMKRYVVLQDEGLILSELTRRRPVARLSAPVVAPALPEIAEPLPASDALLPDEEEDDTVEEISGEDGVDLQALAKRAAQRAERAAIDEALARFRWNRRKAAAYLRVGYKTLLNKMKECGITEAAAS